jgi:hypothetical protein
MEPEPADSRDLTPSARSTAPRLQARPSTGEIPADGVYARETLTVHSLDEIHSFLQAEPVYGRS